MISFIIITPNWDLSFIGGKLYLNNKYDYEYKYGHYLETIGM